MISDNGDSRILRLENGLLQTPTQKDAESKQPATKAYVIAKTDDIVSHYMRQVPDLVGAMLTAALQSYDQAKREAFEKAVSGLGDDGVPPEWVERLREVLGLPSVIAAAENVVAETPVPE